MRFLLLFSLLCLSFISCSSGMTKEETKIAYKHSQLSELEYARAKKEFSKEEQEAIEQRYKQMNRLFKEVLDEQ